MSTKREKELLIIVQKVKARAPLSIEQAEIVRKTGIAKPKGSNSYELTAKGENIAGGGV